MLKWREGPGRQVGTSISQLERQVDHQSGGANESGQGPARAAGRGSVQGPTLGLGQEWEPKPKPCLKGPPQSPCLGRPVGLGHNQVPSLPGANLGFPRPLPQGLRNKGLVCRYPGTQGSSQSDPHPPL